MKDLVLDRLEAAHERLGTAGFALAVIALILTLAGGAYAASGGLTSKQKKEVTKIAKKYAGKPGPAGPAGQNGTPGTNGTNGKDGAPGSPGKAGEDGKSVVLVNEEPVGCENEEGFTYEVEGSGAENEVCHGREGEPWTAGGTLPDGATETGTYFANAAGEFSSLSATLSFAIPLSGPLDGSHVIKVPIGDTTTEHCSAAPVNGTAADPKAQNGYLCVYATRQENAGVQILDYTSDPAVPGAAKSGAVLGGIVVGGINGTIAGTWAVTGS